jgi:hypothetical protein
VADPDRPPSSRRARKLGTSSPVARVVTPRRGHSSAPALREHGRPREHAEVAPRRDAGTSGQSFQQIISERILGCTSSQRPAGQHCYLKGAEDVLIDVGARVTDLIGSDGYRALLGRALCLAAIDFPLLADVRAAESPPGRLLIRGSLDLGKLDAEQLLEASVAVFAHLHDLMEEFLGQELVQTLLWESWPIRLGA